MRANYSNGRIAARSANVASWQTYVRSFTIQPFIFSYLLGLATTTTPATLITLVLQFYDEKGIISDSFIFPVNRMSCTIHSAQTWKTETGIARRHLFTGKSSFHVRICTYLDGTYIRDKNDLFQLCSNGFRNVRCMAFQQNEYIIEENIKMKKICAEKLEKILNGKCRLNGIINIRW